MSFVSTGQPEQGQNEVNVAQALRQSYACGVVLIEDEVSLLTPETALLLGLGAQLPATLPLERLPAELRQLVLEVRADGPLAAARERDIMVGDHHPLAVRAHALPGTHAGVVLVLNDLAPARRLEQNLAQLNRLASLGTLSATMAHEIKNALVAGKTMIDLLIEKNRDAELAGIVRRELGRIDAIVTGMLKLSRPAKTEHNRSLHLHEILEHSLRLIGPRLNTTTLSLEQALHAPSDLVRGNDNELQQAVVNLLLNSLDAMGPEGTLTVTTDLAGEEASTDRLRETSEPPRIRLTIRDTGPGIAPENLGRLFDPFFTTKPSGTGLGLAITQRIIQEHRGEISVESRPGKGAAFRILLPLVTEPESAGR